jgi:mannosyltransferase OCH1-like enzyme|tara:strand:- start:295973 stop:296761 length:789 start_codon:yes stop_codon:yes gene_type:complete
MIPKIIHYCWFGKKPKPVLVQDCIASWQAIVPGYNMQCWDESNVELNHPFLKKAYKEKQWAFVADFVRLQKLAELGGVYMDTDMLLLKSIDPLMEQPAFVGLESERYVSCGIIGAIPQHPYILACYDYYDRLIFDSDFSYKSIIIPKIFTQIYLKKYPQAQIPLIPKQHQDLFVCPVDWFYPFPNENLLTEKYKEYIKPNTFAVHLWHKSWKKTNALHFMREGKVFQSFFRLSNELLRERQGIDKKYLKKIAAALKQHLSNG